jgi:hypothetical protein
MQMEVLFNFLRPKRHSHPFLSASGYKLRQFIDFYIGDGGNIFLRNICNLPEYTVTMQNFQYLDNSNLCALLKYHRYLLKTLNTLFYLKTSNIIWQLSLRILSVYILCCSGLWLVANPCEEVNEV